MIQYQNISSFSFRRRKKVMHDVRKESKVTGFSGWTNSFNYLEPKVAQPLSEMSTFVTQQSLSSSGLSWSGATVDQLEFLKKVYDINLTRKAGRTFVNDVPSTELATVEGRYELRTVAAGSALRMLQAARAAAIAASQNVQVGLTSAYRSATRQFGLWNDYVTNQYYPNTKKHRQGLEGGEHGDEAAQYLARYTSGRIATPGYSNHNNGLALDIRNTENSVILRNRTNNTATTAWRKTWLWDWLVANAATYHFYQNTSIDEPWHWVYRETTAVQQSLLGGVDKIPGLVWPSQAGKQPNFLTAEFIKLINKNNGIIAMSYNNFNTLYKEPVDDYINLLSSNLGTSGGKDEISETITSIAALNAISVVDHLKPLLLKTLNNRLGTIPPEVRIMASRTGLLLAWIDKAIKKETALKIEDYKVAYEDLLMVNESRMAMVDMIFGHLPSNLGFFVSKAVQSLLPQMDIHGALDIRDISLKLKIFYKNLQRDIFSEILDNEILGKDKLRLGIEFENLKGTYADAVIGSWDIETQRLG